MATVLIAVGPSSCSCSSARIFWPQLKKLWAKAKQGGVIPRAAKEYLLHSFLPASSGWQARRDRDLPGGFTIPVTFESIMWVVGELACERRLGHPGGVGVTQATNALALDTCCDVAKSTAVTLERSS